MDINNQGSILAIDTNAIPKVDVERLTLLIQEQKIQLINLEPTKPIAVIRYDRSLLSKETNLNQIMSEKFSDYHVICLPSYQLELAKEEFSLQVFYAKDFKDTDYETIKKLVEDTLKQQNDKAETKY